MGVRTFPSITTNSLSLSDCEVLDSLNILFLFFLLSQWKAHLMFPEVTPALRVILGLVLPARRFAPPVFPEESLSIFELIISV